MSTAISTATGGELSYSSLSPNSRQAAILRANLNGEPMSERDLVKVRTPLGGGTTWSFDFNGNEETCDEIVGLLVAVGKRGVLWPQDDPSDMRPVLISHDLKVGHRVGNDLGSIDPDALEKFRTGDDTYDWVALSGSKEFGYGSARNGAGRKAKESRILAILREGDVWPLLVTVGPGSLAGLAPFMKRLPCFPWEAVVGLRLEKTKSKAGQPYSVIVPRLVGTISEEQGEVARLTYHEPLMAMFEARPLGSGGEG
jgi:hypothetical protein